MLILSRRPEEEIVINDNIIVRIIQVRRDGNVRLGIDAPKNVTIHRREIYDKIKNKNQQNS